MVARRSRYIDGLATGRLPMAAYAKLAVAHHCTWYLGDLSGGQWLGRRLVEAYGFRRQGYRFFVFEGVEPEPFRARYRDQLNAVLWSRAEQDAFLDEVSAAYRLNIDLLAALEARWP